MSDYKAKVSFSITSHPSDLKRMMREFNEWLKQFSEDNPDIRYERMIVMDRHKSPVVVFELGEEK